jgi:ABC-2 type transport system ATP-binding protein
MNAAGKTIILTSHYLEEVEYLCNRIAIIDRGRVVVEADKADLVADGKSLEEKYLSVTQAAEAAAPVLV